jgi:hypothetical protein
LIEAMLDDLIRRVQRAYPQLYLACHVDHTTRRRGHGLSSRDDTERVRTLVASVPARQREHAVRGIEALAAAASFVLTKHPRPR